VATAGDVSKLKYGGLYARQIQARIGRMRGRSKAALVKAAGVVARAVQGGRRVLLSTRLHASREFGPKRQGCPAFIVRVPRRRAEEVISARGKGDVLIAVSGFGSSAEDVAAALAAKNAGLEVVVIGHEPSRDLLAPELLHPSGKSMKELADIYIDTDAADAEGCVKIDGMPWPFAPTKGILSMIAYWSLVGEAVRILGESGRTVEVFRAPARKG
jgi:uncharacterized phosphosugar-binding protein